MEQFTLTDNTLILKIKKVSIVLRSIMFFFTFISFVLPLLGLIINLFIGGGFNIGFIFGMAFFGFIGLTLLRMSLWNTFGREEIIFSDTQITYQADYGWFKGTATVYDYVLESFSIKTLSKNEGTLIIQGEKGYIETVIKMPINEIETLIGVLNQKINR